jgi:hypothetical protein
MFSFYNLFHLKSAIYTGPKTTIKDCAIKAQQRKKRKRRNFGKKRR